MKETDFERVQREQGLTAEEAEEIFPKYYEEYLHRESDSSNDDEYLKEARKNANNCTDGIRNGMSYEERTKAASNLGPNWANIMSGLGDQ